MKKFERFIDPDRMTALFQQRLSEFSQGHLIITECRIGYARYKTYKKPSAWDRSSLAICYHLEIHDRSARKNRGQILYAKAFLRDRSRIEFQKIKGVSSIPSGCEEGIMHLPELDMIVWVFPNDPVLLHLPECIHPEAVKRHLPYDRLPAGLDGAADIVDISSEVIHYRPEARCTTRCRVRWGSPDKQKEEVFFGKTFSDDRGKEIHQRMEALWKISSRDPKRFMVAEPLGYREEIKTVWQSGLKGDPLVNALNQTNDLSILEAVAEGLASFHKSDLHSPVRITLDDHLAEIRKKISKLTRAFPEWREWLQAIERNLTRSIDRLTPIPSKIVHGDFTVQQLLVCEGRIAFFDFDEFAIGDPAQDVANFIVDLQFRSLDPNLVEEMKVVFPRAYQRRIDWPLSADRLNWHLQIQFITKAYRIYIRQRAGMEREIKEIIALAQERLVLEKV
ncbi:MAG: aminoglycoside phosphotransferase family protein (plasmid) [Candidatus Manganitrophus sp.]|nr:aminoglycoside phosphotransferase family protein [Candidatus Manganitrophus sp.]MDC4228197.1 aminoglycoside phosphotransferase family protein [Candidatus Manganitrophus sp.]WDT77718.1 MAG: aminoglycoside phosphotransferase family protein [Candidatus Manganitrophus sp.]